jgi:hypothetical protein
MIPANFSQDETSHKSDFNSCKRAITRTNNPVHKSLQSIRDACLDFSLLIRG